MLRETGEWDVRCPEALIYLFPVRRGYWFKVTRAQARKVCRALARAYRVSPPKVSERMPGDGNRGVYWPATRTMDIYPRCHVKTVMHEFYHHLDEVTGGRFDSNDHPRRATAWSPGEDFRGEYRWRPSDSLGWVFAEKLFALLRAFRPESTPETTEMATKKRDNAATKHAKKATADLIATAKKGAPPVGLASDAEAKEAGLLTKAEADAKFKALAAKGAEKVAKEKEDEGESRTMVCPTCKGKGGPPACPTCHGAGRVRTPKAEEERAAAKGKKAPPPPAAKAPAAAAPVTPAKGKAPASPPPAASPGRKPPPRRSSEPDTRVFTFVGENPRRPGTMAHRTFALYRKGMSVQDFLEKCQTHNCDPGYLKADERAGRVKLEAK